MRGCFPSDLKPRCALVMMACKYEATVGAGASCREKGSDLSWVLNIEPRLRCVLGLAFIIPEERSATLCVSSAVRASRGRRRGKVPRQPASLSPLFPACLLWAPPPRVSWGTRVCSRAQTRCCSLDGLPAHGCSSPCFFCGRVLCALHLVLGLGLGVGRDPSFSPTHAYFKSRPGTLGHRVI